MDIPHTVTTPKQVSGVETSGDHSPLAWLQRAEREGTSLADALEMFDSLPAAPMHEMPGRWRGGGLHTGHVLDGLLEAFGWYGKSFVDRETVHPLLFHYGEDVIAINPQWLPVALAGRLKLQHRRSAIAMFKSAKALIATKQPAARLREVSCRGVMTSAMVYDRQPIIDFFRMVAPGVLLGLMDYRDHAPLFFTLRKTSAPGPA